MAAPTGPAQDGELPAGSCRATRVDRRVSFARTCRRERLRSTFWFIPSLFIVGSIALSAVVYRIDVSRDVSPADAPWWLASNASAQSVLSTISSAMLTFVGVVFSVTLVALQLASSQLSPRVLRNFVRSPVPKLAFGTFMGTYFFSLFMLSQVSSEPAEVPVLGATLSMLFVLASVGMFVVYIDATVRQMQVSQVISRVARETRRAVDVNYLGPDGYLVAPAPSFDDRPVTIEVGRGRARLRPLKRRGALLGVDVARVVDWAGEHGAVVRQLVRVGDYVSVGTPLFEVHGASADDAVRLAEMIDLGRERTLYQDPLYGVRQLVDTASQALSPAVNAPTTAVQVIDRLVDILTGIGSRPAPTPQVVDAAGTVRLIHPVVHWDEVVALAFVEIRQFGVRSTQVTRRLMAAFATIEAAVPPERRPQIVAQREAMSREVRRLVVEPADREFALLPDDAGLT